MRFNFAHAVCVYISRICLMHPDKAMYPHWRDLWRAGLAVRRCTTWWELARKNDASRARFIENDSHFDWANGV
ncbi:hypothetical protein J3E68DRAFT_407557 [Trichoderma sp. SZMC 28012]